jgi:ParB family chromosome partitioning protein
MIQPTERTNVRLRRSRIKPDPNNARQEIALEKLRELADNIRVHGLLTPLIVGPADAEGDHPLVDGHRRLQAMALAQLDEADCIILPGMPDAGELVELQLSLGVTNEQLSPLEVAEGAQRLMALKGMTPAQVARKIGVTEATLSKYLRIGADVAESLREDVRAGRIPFTVAYHLARLPDHAGQAALAERFKAGEVSRDELAGIVSSQLAGRKAKARPVKGATKAGLTVIVPGGMDAEAALAELKAVAEAISKAQKFNLGMDNFPSLLGG